MPKKLQLSRKRSSAQMASYGQHGQRTALSTVLLVFMACLACLYTAGRRGTLPRGVQSSLMA